MDELDLGQRIRSHRKKLRLTQGDVAKYLKISTDFVSRLEKGDREPSDRTLASLEAFLSVSNPDIVKNSTLTAEGRPEGAFDIPLPSGKIPIISWAQAGPDGFFADSFPAGSGFADINRPYDVTDPNAYALVISGESMAPKYEPGDIILVSPNMGVQTGDYAVVRLKDGTVMAKRVREKNSHFIFESVNPDYPSVECAAEDVVFTHRIVWVKQRG
jgi:phage repressor protein C with HTH and peptisase S24 domain